MDRNLSHFANPGGLLCAVSATGYALLNRTGVVFASPGACRPLEETTK